MSETCPLSNQTEESRRSTICMKRRMLFVGARTMMGSFLLEVGSVRADVRSCCHRRDEAQLALRKTTIFVSSVFTHMDLEGNNIVFAKDGRVKIFLQPCGHEEAVSTFKIHLASMLPGDKRREELQAKHIEVSAGFLHASTGMRFSLELPCSNSRGRSSSLSEIMQIVTSAVCVFSSSHCSVAKDDGFFSGQSP